MMRITGWLAVLSSMSFLAAQEGSSEGADTLSYGDASSVQMSGAKLGLATDPFEKAVEKGELQGVVLLVARRRAIVLHDAHGWRDLDKKKPMRKDSLFRMASNAKALTAAGILILVDAGKLGLDDPVGKYLPSFRSSGSEKITIRHLLTHTSGLRIRTLFLRPLLEKSAEHPDAPSLQAEVSRFGKIGAKVEPGTSFSYNNPGYNTLAALVEVASGIPYKKFLADRIYGLLGMKDSCNHESDADHARMSAVFRSRGDDGWRLGWQPGDPPDYPFPRGSGGMISTVFDYAIFCQAYMNGGTYGGKRLLSEALVKQATHSQSEHIAAAGNYGFGLRETDGVCSHGGSDGTWAWFDPKRQIVGCVFTQNPGSSGRQALADEFRRLVEAACEDE